MNTDKQNKPRNVWQRKPTWQTYYDLGTEVNKRLPKFMTLPAIARSFGISRQNAHVEVVIALGKVCYQLKYLRTQESLHA